MSIKLNSSGGGSVTLSEPTTSIDYNLTLPAGSGIIPGVQHFSVYSGLAGSSATGAQNILGVGVTLSSNTAYAFDADFNFFKTAGTTSHTFSFQWGGTATLNKIATNIFSTDSANGYVTLTRSVGKYVLESAGPVVLTGAITSAFYTVNLRLTGIVHVTNGGTLIPQYALSAAPGGAYTTSAFSYMNIWPIGATGANVNIGTWA